VKKGASKEGKRELRGAPRPRSALLKDEKSDSIKKAEGEEEFASKRGEEEQEIKRTKGFQIRGGIKDRMSNSPSAKYFSLDSVRDAIHIETRNAERRT